MRIARFKSAGIISGDRPLRYRLILIAIALFIAFTLLQLASAQEMATTEEYVPPGIFRIGERLSYNFSFRNIPNAAYAEFQVVSQGKLDGRDAVELRSKFKTNNFVGAVFYLIDESRTTFASSETGLPLFSRQASNTSGLPRETISNYLVEPAGGYDFLTLIYQARQVGGIGSFPLLENGTNYQVNLQTTISEEVKTAAGNFDTSVSTLQSEFLTERGIRDFRINFSRDEARLPVLIRFRTDKGDFRGEIASIQIIETGRTIQRAPRPTPPIAPPATPTPAPTPTPFIENQPLSEDLAFRLGETLEFKVTSNGVNFGTVVIKAKERNLYQGKDSLLLTARATVVDPANNLFGLNDGIAARVDPDTLAPIQLELNFTGELNKYNQIVAFDQKAGTATFNGQILANIPVGTHSILSLAYAIRSFNLKPSRDPRNPVNDTRVAVFAGDRATVFILRPSDAEIINIRNEKVPAQLISISTGVAEFDKYNIRLWLSTDDKRVPLRFTIGTFQADLVSTTYTPPDKISRIND